MEPGQRQFAQCSCAGDHIELDEDPAQFFDAFRGERLQGRAKGPHRRPLQLECRTDRAREPMSDDKLQERATLIAKRRCAMPQGWSPFPF